MHAIQLVHKVHQGSYFGGRPLFCACQTGRRLIVDEARLERVFDEGRRAEHSRVTQWNHEDHDGSRV